MILISSQRDHPMLLHSKNKAFLLTRFLKQIDHSGQLQARDRKRISSFWPSSKESLNLWDHGWKILSPNCWKEYLKANEVCVGTAWWISLKIHWSIFGFRKKKKGGGGEWKSHPQNVFERERSFWEKLFLFRKKNQLKMCSNYARGVMGKWERGWLPPKAFTPLPFHYLVRLRSIQRLF